MFFLEIRPIEELQDSKSSPRREEVGRRTLGAIGGFPATCFYQASFGLFTQQIPLFIERLQKLSLRSLQTPSEWKNRLRLDELYTSDVAIPLEDES